MVGMLYHLGRVEARRRAPHVLERFALTDAGDRRASTYSGGMRRRLDLAATLVGQPRVVFLDEPTTGLDPRSRAELWATVRELRAGGTTILLTTRARQARVARRPARRVRAVRGVAVPRSAVAGLRYAWVCQPSRAVARTSSRHCPVAPT